MWGYIKQYPVLFQGLVQAILALGCSFGLRLSGEQIGSILTVSAAVLAFVTHQQVTPIVNPRTNDGRQLVPAGSGSTATRSPVS